MSYTTGFLLAVPEANKQRYTELAAASWDLFKEYGALSCQENWENDVPEGEVTSFTIAVKREKNEAIVFSWITWPDKATADACWASFETDARWDAMKEMPFDGKRMIFGGFETIFKA